MYFRTSAATAALALALAFCVCAPAPAAAGSPEEWKSRTIYQVLTDRFNKPSGGSCDNLSDYCGGTFQGIIDQLDYITGLGADAIWISPVVANTPNGYHGYWAQDLYSINPNFGTADDLVALVQACHQRGVWVMVDVVGNHMGYADVSSFVPFNSQSDFHDCNSCPSGCNINNFNDQEQVEICRLAGLPDLNQTVPYVANTLASWVQGLVGNYSFDGIRVDTVPEVAKTFWPKFQAAAGVYAVGEVDNGNPAYVGPYQGAALDGILSYPMFWTLRHVFAQKQSMNGIQSMLGQMKTYFKDVSLLGSFVDNHDNPRFLSENSDHTAYKAALAYAMFCESIPIVYYGSEQGFNGGNDPDNREPLWPTGFSTSTDLYKYLQVILNFRKKAEVWNYPQVQRYASDSFYAFSRGDTFVALTNGGSSGAEQKVTITYSPYADGTKICNLFYPTSDCITVSNGSFTVYLVNGQTKIYSPNVSAILAAHGHAAAGSDANTVLRSA